jgi:uncharacterized membrane protein YcaP (DUF421 family)
MQPDIHPFELKRLLIGEAPALFLLETAARALVIYLVLLLAARLLGKRVAGQMSVLELTIVVTLGAAIGVPLETPERGLLPALIVLAIAVIYQRLIGRATFRNRRAVAILEGKTSVLVRDGVIDLDTLRELSVSRERLYAMLREQQVLQLGQVKRAYLEASGGISVYLDDSPHAGLSVLPGDDRRLYEDQFAEPGAYACRSCGRVEPGNHHPPDHGCPHCHADQWGSAVRRASIRDLDTHAERA